MNMENFNKDEPFIVTQEDEKNLDIGFFMNSAEIEAKFKSAEESLKGLEAELGSNNPHVISLRETVQWLMETFMEVKAREMKASLN